MHSHYNSISPFFCRALDEAVEAFNRAEVEGKGERKKGEKSAKDAARRRAELEELKEKKEHAKEEFKGMEEKASDVRTWDAWGG